MRKLIDLPSQDGFKFIAILKDGKEVLTTLIKEFDGVYNFPEFTDCIGWVSIQKYNEQDCIKYLKSLGYKVYKQITEFKEC